SIHPAPTRSPHFRYTTLCRSRGAHERGLMTLHPAVGMLCDPGVHIEHPAGVADPQPAARVRGRRNEPVNHTALQGGCHAETGAADRKSTRLNSSHQIISYAVF